MSPAVDTLAHHLLLLELDDSTGRSLQKDSLLAHYGINGAMIAELMWRDRLVAVAADRFVLRPGRPAARGAVRLAEERLSETRPRTLQRSLSRLRYSALRRALLAELVEAGALREEKERFLVLFQRRRWRPGARSPEETLVEHLRRYMADVTEETPPTREDLLLSLLRVTALLETVWPPEALAGGLRARIEARTARAPIGQEVHGAVTAARAAAAAAAAAAS